MNHKEKLEKLGLEKQKLIAALNEIEGAMKYAIQCLQSEATSEQSLPSDIKASKQPKETELSKSKA